MMNDPHILSAYDEELKELRSVVSRMGGMAIDQLLAAMEALREVNVQEAEQVLQNDRKLDKMEIHAEKTAIGVFARRAPVADDLREVVSSIKMTTMIERMGDYAKNISLRTLDIAECSPVVMPQILDNMAEVAHHMIEDVMNAYVHRNADMAVDVWERDETLDNMHNAAYRQILARMMEIPDHIDAYSHYLIIAKNLERIGDQVTNIAEQIYYAITGDILEGSGHKEKEKAAE